VPGLHKHEDQVGGMTWRLRGLTFASIKGAGHMAPKDKRKEGLTLITYFLSGNPLPNKS
jgi:carboxypeptidase C (cathepsin A)